MVELKLDPNGNGIVAEDIWVSGMRQAGLSEQDISRVVSATTALADPSNGHGELVPVKEAARRIGRSENTVRSWIRLGHLQAVEIPLPSGHANGAWVQVYMTEVEDLHHNPPRHRRHAPPSAPGGLLTLRQAAEKFGISLSRIRSWCQRGHLRTYTPRRVGKASLISPDDVADLITNPPRRGPSPKRQ